MSVAGSIDMVPESGPLEGLRLPIGEQSPPEIEWLLSKIAGARSVLEIGSRGGNNLRCLAAVCHPGAKLRSIELIDHGGKLGATMDWLRERGYDAELLVANSQSPKAWQWAHDNGPFDFVFIDGDHSYYAVLADWMMYGTLGRVVGFHDIHHPHGPSQLWQEIKAAKYVTEEIHQGFDIMGIGLIHMWQKE
jgi:predicted O-methyltransferase YrrM